MVEDDQSVLVAALSPHEVDWITQQHNFSTDTATAILFRARATIASLHFLSTAAVQAMDARLQEKEASLGVCKRLLGSPSPLRFRVNRLASCAYT